MAVPADQGSRLRDGTLLGGFALQAAHSARPHDRTSAGLHHLAFRAAANLDRAGGRGSRS